MFNHTTNAALRAGRPAHGGNSRMLGEVAAGGDKNPSGGQRDGGGTVSGHSDLSDGLGML